MENLDELASLLEQLRDGTADLSAPAVKKNSVANARPVNVAPAAAQVSPALPGESPPEVAATNDHKPEPAVSVPAVALTADNVEQVWKQALDSLTGIIAENASHVDEVSLDATGRLQITFSNTFYRDACERPANRARLEAALAEACGQRVPLVFQARQRVDAPAAAAPPAPSRRQQQADVAAQPFVKKALELFDGDPHKIRYIPPTE
jgi:hypothetical protein